MSVVPRTAAAALSRFGSRHSRVRSATLPSASCPPLGITNPLRFVTFPLRPVEYTDHKAHQWIEGSDHLVHCPSSRSGCKAKDLTCANPTEPTATSTFDDMTLPSFHSGLVGSLDVDNITSDISKLRDESDQLDRTLQDLLQTKSFRELDDLHQKRIEDAFGCLSKYTRLAACQAEESLFRYKSTSGDHTFCPFNITENLPRACEANLREAIVIAHTWSLTGIVEQLGTAITMLHNTFSSKGSQTLREILSLQLARLRAEKNTFGECPSLDKNPADTLTTGPDTPYSISFHLSDAEEQRRIRYDAGQVLSLAESRFKFCEAAMRAVRLQERSSAAGVSTYYSV